MKYEDKNKVYFEMLEVIPENCNFLRESRPGELSLIWFTQNDNVLRVDSVEQQFSAGEIIFITEFHHIEVVRLRGLKLLRFNKPFYCVTKHDNETGCRGILYYGASALPLIRPEAQDRNGLEVTWDILISEMLTKDGMQLEMLQMMLKRLLILCTRIYKAQGYFKGVDTRGVEIIRTFNYLVETHFRTLHLVSEYADMLNKSPKTLANIFAKMKTKTPLQFIQDRRMLEARRLLLLSLSVSEVGYKIGFMDVQAFSRFFKAHEGVSPMEFKAANANSGSIANKRGSID